MKMINTDQKLTVKQEKFIDLVMSGLNYSEAYRQSYDAGNMNPNTINRKAYDLINKDYITARIWEKRQEIQNLELWRREQSIKILASIAEDTENNSGFRVAAVKELNAMHGYNKPIEIKHKNIIDVKPVRQTKEEIEQELIAMGIDPKKVALDE